MLNNIPRFISSKKDRLFNGTYNLPCLSGYKVSGHSKNALGRGQYQVKKLSNLLFVRYLWHVFTACCLSCLSDQYWIICIGESQHDNAGDSSMWQQDVTVIAYLSWPPWAMQHRQDCFYLCRYTQGGQGKYNGDWHVLLSPALSRALSR